MMIPSFKLGHTCLFIPNSVSNYKVTGWFFVQEFFKITTQSLKFIFVCSITRFSTFPLIFLKWFLLVKYQGCISVIVYDPFTLFLPKFYHISTLFVIDRKLKNDSFNFFELIYKRCQTALDLCYVRWWKFAVRIFLAFSLGLFVF